MGDRVDFTSGDLTCFISCSASNCLAFSFTVILGPLIFWKSGLLTSSLLSGFSAPSSLAVSLCCCHWMGSMTTALPRDPDVCLLARWVGTVHARWLPPKEASLQASLEGERVSKVSFLFRRNPVAAGLCGRPSMYNGFRVVSGFSSDKKVMLLEDLGRLLFRDPLILEFL